MATEAAASSQFGSGAAHGSFEIISWRRWRHWLMPLMCLSMVAGALLWARALNAESASWPGVALTQAEEWVEALPSHGLPAADARWQRRNLPDSWGASRPGWNGTVWYRVRFPLVSQGEALAVLVPRVAADAQVYLNGSAIGGDADLHVAGSRNINDPLLLRLPTALLRSEGNELLFRVAGSAGHRAGLSQVQLAPLAPLHDIYAHRQFWQHDGALISNAISVVAGLLVLLTWMGARRDPLFLLFGLATVAWAVRNSKLFIDALPISADAWSALVHTGHCWSTVLFCLFVLRYANVRWPRFERLLWGFVIVSSLLGLGGSFHDVRQLLRWTILPSTGILLVMTWLLVRKAWRDGSVEAALLASTQTVLMVLGVRDALLIADRLPYGSYYISHYIGLLLFLSIAWVLMRRYAQSLGALEASHGVLQARLAEREAQLRTLFEREQAMETERVTLAERRRILSDMHDGVGGQLVSALHAARSGQLDAAALGGVIQECIDELRLVIDAMEPVERDLVVLLGNFRYRMAPRLQAAGLRIEWAVTPIPDLAWLQPTHMLQVLRVVQECVTNALKHARASCIRVETVVHLDDGRQWVQLRISDDGTGFDAQAVRPGKGLGSMAARAAAMGCVLTVERRAPGTRVCLSMPVHEPHTGSAASAVATLA